VAWLKGDAWVEERGEMRDEGMVPPDLLEAIESLWSGLHISLVDITRLTIIDMVRIALIGKDTPLLLFRLLLPTCILALIIRRGL
jgi:hypothetical protein